MTISRLSHPQEFKDKASRVGLVQPVPMFALARVLFSAVSIAQLSKAMPEGVPMGGSSPSFEDMQLELDPIRASVVKVYDDYMGIGNAGQTLTFDRPIFGGGGYTIEARTARAEVDTSLSPLLITGETASLTLRILEGPYGASGSAVQPYALAPNEVNGNPARFGQKLFEQLNYDRVKLVDSILVSLGEANAVHLAAGDSNDSLNGSVLATVATNAFLVQGDRPADVDMLMRGAKILKDASVPTLDNGRYVALLTTRQCVDIRRDPDFKQASQFDSKANILKDSYIGSIHGVDVYEVATLGTAVTGGVTYQKGIMLGAGAIGYAPGTPCEVVQDERTNFGKRLAFIWRAVEAYVRLDSRMGVSLLSD